jgi:23S rRNA (guanosine2251-2'-O)-methyltransferase
MYNHHMKELVVIAHNIRSLHNVGSIFRTAEGANVAKVYLTGYTGTPPRKEISKVALHSEERIPWEYAKTGSAVIKKLKKEGFKILALEQDPRSVSYRSYKPDSNKIALIVGNEIRGVSKALRDNSDTIIEIPMLGGRKSLNVSVAFGIAIYDLAEKLF